MRRDFIQRCEQLLEEISAARREGRTLVFLDEINFTKRSLVQREWSGKNSNLTVDQEDVYVGFRSVIAAMTEEEGIKHVRIQSEAVAVPHFIEYLKQLRRKMGQTPIALFCDQLAVHRSKDVKPWYE